MKGVVFLGNRKLELRRFPDPTPGPRDVILAIKASGMCGSDLHTYRAPANPGGVVTGGIKRAHRRHRQGSPDRPTRDGPPLRRLRQLQALPRGLDADVPQGTGGLRLRRSRRPREVHEGAGVDAGAVAGLALLRHRGRHLLRHRHGLGRAAPGRAAGRRNDRHLRPGPGGPVGDAAGRRDGRASSPSTSHPSDASSPSSSEPPR